MLGSDSWDVILGYLDASDTIRLLLTGDATLLALVKPAIRDFVACLETTTSLSLCSLLNIFKSNCSNSRRFSISLGSCYRRFRFKLEGHTPENWQTLFSENLEVLELGVTCTELPISSLLESLATVTPRLKKLITDNVPKKLSLPESLIFFGILVPT